MACPFDSPSCFSVVNVTGLSFEHTLQAAVAQGLANRAHGPAVYLMGIGRFPGMAGIEWFPGTGCSTCRGVRERWLQTVEEALLPARRSARWITAKQLIEQVRPLVSGGVLWAIDEPHSLGAVMTLCGVHDLLPATSTATLPRGLTVHFDTRRQWSNATAAARFVGGPLLRLTNASTLALQAPTNLPFLADAVVAWRLPMLWMPDMCHDTEQNRVLRAVLEGSGHFDASPTVQYLGWFNNTHLPNPELVCQCTGTRRLLTVASDWSENLSFLSRLPRAASAEAPLRQPADAVRVHAYSPELTYVAVVVSDGDNLAQDWSDLRPTLERRLALRSRTPLSWTVSNRWATDFGGPIARWFYDAAARSGGYDSFLMGPSGYGYVFPGAMADAAARAEFGARAVDAAGALDMEAYVHWDVDQALDPRSKERTGRRSACTMARRSAAPSCSARTRSPT